MQLCLLALPILLVTVANCYPRPPLQVTDESLNVGPLQEQYNSAKEFENKADVRERIDTFLKRKTKMPMKEKKLKDGIRTMRFKKVRRVGPPFSEYLEGSQKQELLEVIKQARAIGKTQDEVRQTIDSYLQSHLSAEKLAKIEKVKAEGAIQEQERLEKDHLKITDTEHQLVNRFLNEAREQLNGLLDMTQSQRSANEEVVRSVDNYLQNISDDRAAIQVPNEAEECAQTKIMSHQKFTEMLLKGEKYTSSRNFQITKKEAKLNKIMKKDFKKIGR